MTSGLRISEEVVRGSRVFITLGYILRIIIITNIPGSILTLVGWLKIFRKLRSRAYLVALIGSIILLTSLLYHTYVSLSEDQAGVIQLPREELTFYEQKELYRNSVLTLIRNMENPHVYISQAFVALGILLEVPGVAQLSRDSRRYIPSYLTPLFIIVAFLNLIVAVLYPISVTGAREILYEIERAESLQDLNLAFMKIALLPVSIIGVIILAVNIITYVQIAYKYWRLYGELVRLRIMMGSESAVEAI